MMIAPTPRDLDMGRGHWCPGQRGRDEEGAWRRGALARGRLAQEGWRRRLHGLLLCSHQEALLQLLSGGDGLGSRIPPRVLRGLLCVVPDHVDR